MTDPDREGAAVETLPLPDHLCRTCLAPIWHEVGEVGHREQVGWSDRIKRGGDSLVCFKAIGYRHEPLTDRERAYYEAGARAVIAAGWVPQSEVAERERAAAEKALRDAADEVFRISLISAGSPIYRADLADWLRARADRLGGGEQR